MRIPLCAIIFGAASRSTELQLRAFPRSLPMMNVDSHYHTIVGEYWLRNILTALISPRIQFLKKLPNMMTHVHTYKIQNLIIKISFIFKNWTSSQMKCTIASFLVNLVSQFDRFDRLCAHLTNFEKFSFSPFLVVTLLKSINLWNCFHKHL